MNLKFFFTQILVLTLSATLYAQTPFFKSDIAFTNDQLDGYSFYSSFSLDQDQVYFNANDYKLYVFDLKSGKINWQYNSKYKSNNSPVVHHNWLFITANTQDYGTRTYQLNAKTGELLQELKIESINTRPHFRDTIMYCTAIEGGGKILAYDLEKNEVVWSEFIAHGVSKQPYFYDKYLLASADGESWLALDYDGKYLKEDCDSQFFIDSTEVCLKEFKWLNFRGEKLTNKILEDLYEIRYHNTQDRTIAVTEDKLFVFGKRNKLKHTLNLYTTGISEEDLYISEYFEFLQTKGNNVWFIYQNHLLIYDCIAGKVQKLINLKEWNPHQAVMRNNKLWLISKEDGQLYGLNLD